MRNLLEFRSPFRAGGENGHGDTRPPVVLRGVDFECVPEQLEGAGLRFEHRRRYASFGLVDNCVLTLSREASSALGAWMVACLLQRNHRIYDIVMVAPAAGPQEPRPAYGKGGRSVDLDAASRSRSAPRRAAAGNRPANRVIRNHDDFYKSIDEWNERDIVSVSGSIEAMLLLGGFFLDFGHPYCMLNYEYIKGVGNSVPDLATPSSCEFRVELAGAR